MFGGMLEFETLAALRHIDGGLVVRRGDGIMDAIVEGGDFETRQRPRRTGKRFGRSRSESTKERAWFCCPRTYRRFGVWLNFRARRDLDRKSTRLNSSH